MSDRRRPLFDDTAAVSLVWRQILRVASAEKFAILAYCFMPDHVHLLIEGVDVVSDARKFIIKTKQCSAHAYAKTFGCRLWQPFGYEHVLRRDENMVTVARYIVENRVRAGLATSPVDPPFVGSEICAVEDLVRSLPVGANKADGSTKVEPYGDVRLN